MSAWLIFHFHAAAQPHIAQQPQSRTAVAGALFSFAVKAVGSTPLQYQWQFQGQDIPGARGRVLTRTAAPSRAGIYSVRVRDGSGEVTSGGASLEVFKRPVILVQPRNIIVGEHTVAEFRVVLNESGPYRRMIWHNDNPVEGPHEIPPSTGYITDQPTLRMENPLNDATWNSVYWFAVTNGGAGTTSRRARLTVVGAPVLRVQPQHQTARAGSFVTFSVRVVPNPGSPETFQWYKDGSIIPGAVANRLTLKNVQAGNVGNYYCIVSGIGGKTTSWGGHLTVSSAPAP